jgi:2-keto-3-deoxy-L-rhamnonate aldolase RhmA
LIANSAKRKAAAGELVLGMGVRQSRTSDHALLCKTCGFDWLFIDLEHSSLSIEQAGDLCATALLADVTPFVRVTSHAHHHSARLLDNGALGIIVPDVDTAEQARAVVRNCRYPPVGKRSIPSGVPQLLFAPTAPHDMMAALNREVMLVVMLESAEGIANVDEIAAVEGIDALIIGASDLSARLGVPGQAMSPPMQASFEALIAAARRHGKIAGFAGIGDEAAQRNYIARGANFVQCGTDIQFLQRAASDRVDALRRAAAPAA